MCFSTRLPANKSLHDKYELSAKKEMLSRGILSVVRWKMKRETVYLREKESV